MNIPPHLMNEHYDDRYFDVVNALDEAQQIFFRHNQLETRLSQHRNLDKPFLIGETGFGAGRVVVSLMDFVARQELGPVNIHYHSVELHPMKPERMQALLHGFRDRAGVHIDALVSAYRQTDTGVPGWHTMVLPLPPGGSLRLNLYVGEALEMVQALESPCDVWFLDGHSPKKNPEIWRPELMMAIGEKTKAGGSCATFTVAVAVQHALRTAGFTIEKLPGCGGKKEVLHGMKESAYSQSFQTSG